MLENGLLDVNQKYDRAGYDKVCVRYRVKKYFLLGLGLVILIANLVISPSGWILFEAFVLAVVIVIILISDTSVEDAYERTFLIPYVRNKFCGEYIKGFDFVSDLTSNASFEANEATKIFQLLPFRLTGGSVKCMIDGHVNFMNIKIYSYERKEQIANETHFSSGVLVVLPLLKRIAEPVLILKSANYADRPLDMDRYEYDGMLIYTKRIIEALGQDDGAGRADEKKRENTLGEIIQSESFLDMVSYAYTQSGGMPNVYFYENKAYIYVRTKEYVYYKMKPGQKNHELEALDKDTGIFWPFCEILMTRTDVFGEEPDTVAE
ncbi:MAG: hypothetical protein IJ165_12655 [Proteobacteria bacterium]|nr:hypothetical protein [Pseudomonadota bacterium]